MDRTQGLGSFITQAVGILKPKPKPMKIRAQAARRATARQMKSTRPVHSPAQQYPHRAASISLEHCPNACEAVKEVQGLKFLIRKVPTLPLPDCTSPNCKCAYVRHKDRRGINGDRRALFSLGALSNASPAEGERRHKYGRRSGDESEIEDFDFAAMR